MVSCAHVCVCTHACVRVQTCVGSGVGDGDDTLVAAPVGVGEGFNVGLGDGTRFRLSVGKSVGFGDRSWRVGVER